jgi:hypothetical protein
MTHFVFVITIFIFGTTTLFGQYSFEVYPSIKYKEIKKWKEYDRCDKDKKVHYTVTIPNFYANHDTVTVQLTTIADDSETSIIRVFRNQKQIHKYKEPYSIGQGGDCFKITPTPQKIYLQDINGDGLNDLKILIPRNGFCGGYNYYLDIVYLFQRTDETFTKISFSDLMMNYELRPERDIDGDGNYEIITQTFQNYGDHNYWLFNLYNFTGDGLVNVNYKDNYPIMVQLLYRDNFAITKNLSREKMKNLARKLPDDYNKK